MNQRWMASLTHVSAKARVTDGERHQSDVASCSLTKSTLFSRGEPQQCLKFYFEPMNIERLWRWPVANSDVSALRINGARRPV